MYTATRSIFRMSLPLLLFGSCASNEIGQSKDVNQETIYQQYDVSYDENDDKTEVQAQFRFAGVNGTTLVLNEPSKFTLDGELLKVDSSEYSGAFYKTVIPGKSSLGKHRLIFTNIDRKRFENEFSIEHFGLAELPATFSKSAPAMVRFEAPLLREADYVELNAAHTDSSFTIRHLATEPGNSFSIPVEQLQRQKGREFSLSAILYRKVPLSQQAKEGGEITVTQVTKPVTIKLRD